MALDVDVAGGSRYCTNYSMATPAPLIYRVFTSNEITNESLWSHCNKNVFSDDLLKMGRVRETFA